MKSWSAILLGMVLAGTGAVSAASGESGRLEESKVLSISAAAVGNSLSKGDFKDHRGRPFDFAQLRGQAVVMPLIYTGCYHTCPLIAESLLRAVAAARQSLARDSFQVVVVGFEAGVDTPERMRAFAQSQGLDQPGWIFISGDEPAIETLVREVGFTYERSPRGFDHIAQTTIVDGSGKVYWQVYGAEFKSSAIVEPLKQLVYGRPVRFDDPTTWWSRLRLLCTVYDPTQDRYRFSYAIFIGLFVGVFSLGGTAWFLIRSWARLRSERA